MNLNVVSPEVPIFTNTKNEALSLNKIIEDKKITSVTIAYLSKEKKVKVKGIKGYFGLKEIKQEEKN